MPKFYSFIEQLKIRVKKPLPGFEAQKIMMPEGRDTIVPKNYKKAAVLLLLYPFNNHPYFILIKRVNDNTPHSGQISLPGGQQEVMDTSLWQTAKRETAEEIGITINDEDMIGHLSPLYIPVSNFCVYPFIAYKKKMPNFLPNYDEVENIIQANYQNFFKPENIVKRKFLSNKKIIFAPAYYYKNYYIWGATAMILSEFYYISKNFN